MINTNYNLFNIPNVQPEVVNALDQDKTGDPSQSVVRSALREINIGSEDSVALAIQLIEGKNDLPAVEGLHELLAFEKMHRGPLRTQQFADDKKALLERVVKQLEGMLEEQKS